MNAKHVMLVVVIAFALAASCLYVVNSVTQSTVSNVPDGRYESLEAYRNVPVQPLGDPIDNPGGPATK